MIDVKDAAQEAFKVGYFFVAEKLAVGPMFWVQRWGFSQQTWCHSGVYTIYGNIWGYGGNIMGLDRIEPIKFGEKLMINSTFWVILFSEKPRGDVAVSEPEPYTSPGGGFFVGALWQILAWQWNISH